MLERVYDTRWWLGARPKFVSEGVPEMSVAVVIPAFNEERTIRNTIRSVKNQTIPIEDIYVVDDCSSDRTGKIALREGVSVIRTPNNQGTKSRALNWALVRIQSTLVVTIDADTILAPDAIEKSLRYFNREDTFAVCGMVVPQRIESVWERGRFVEYLYTIEIMKCGQNNCGLIMVSSGCFTVFRNEHLQSLGLFKERSMAEDMDLTWEAHFTRNKKVYCEINAVCYPLDPPTLSIYYNQLRRWYSGFLQCMAIHKGNLCCNWKFGALYFFYMIEAIFFPISAVALLIYNLALWKVLLVIVILHEMLVIVPVMFRGWRLRMFWKAMMSLPAYYITRPVNLAAWYASLFQEWIFRNKMIVWKKGH